MDNIEKIEELYEIVKADSTNFQAVRELSVALLDAGYNEEALKQLVYLVGIFPEDARLYFNIGFTFEKLKMFEKAEYSYRKAISLDPDEPDYLYNLGYLLMNQKIKTKEAVECFKKVLQKEPDDANTFFNLGFLYMRAKSYETAIKCFNKAYDLNNYDILSLFYMGNACHKNGDVQKAKEIYEKVIEFSPEYSWAYFNLAQIAWQEENTQLAIEMLQKTLSINPKDIEASKLLTQIYIKFGDYKEAQYVLNSAIEQNPYLGDYYYYFAKTMPYDKETQIEYMKKALENIKTLTISPEQIKNELKLLRKND